jgi:hypothetical protein
VIVPAKPTAGGAVRAASPLDVNDDDEDDEDDEE